MKKLLLILLLVIPSHVTSDSFPPEGPGSKPLCLGTSLSLTTSGTSEEVLATCTIPGGSLNGSYRGFEILVTWMSAANANLKTAGVSLDGDSPYFLNNGTNGNAQPMVQWAKCLVETSSSIRCIGNQDDEGVANVFYAPTDGATQGFNFNNDIDLEFYAETATQAGDITLTGYRVELLR